MTKITPSEWLKGKGAAFVRRAYGERHFTEVSDQEVADYLSPFMALDGVEGVLTPAIVGKVRSRLGVVARRSPRPRPEVASQPSAATLPFPEPAANPHSARVVGLLEELLRSNWAIVAKLEQILHHQGLVAARAEDRAAAEKAA